jgi:hypothetical protein
MAIFAIISSVFAFIFVVSTVGGCWFVEVGGSYLTLELKAGFGLFTYEDRLQNDDDDFECVEYPDRFLDSSFVVSNILHFHFAVEA